MPYRRCPRIVLVILLATLALLPTGMTSANAAFPGSNGLLALPGHVHSLHQRPHLGRGLTSEGPARPV